VGLEDKAVRFLIEGFRRNCDTLRSKTTSLLLLSVKESVDVVSD